VIRKYLTNILFRIKHIDIDFTSSLNRSVILLSSFKTAKIRNSNLELTTLGNKCFIEHVTTYGDIRLSDYVSISGPGTVLHAVVGCIKIGSFCSIGQNVSIQEFNHAINKPTSYAMSFHFFTHEFKDDVISKGDVVIEEDVWIGSNASILSGVKVGRGSIIAAGAVVSKDVPPYSIVGGIPAKVIKMRFNQSRIKELEDSNWWTWSEEKIKQNRAFFNYAAE